MIAKVISSTSFINLTEYLFGNREVKEEAKVLAVNSVRYDTPKNMANDFQFIARQRPGKRKAAMHLIISFHKLDKIGTYDAIKIAEAYLAELKLNNTQYAIIEHSGVKKHKHLHVAINMVNLDGESLNESFLGVRCKKVSENLTKKYSLIEVQDRSREFTNLAALNSKEKTKAEIYFKVQELLTYVNSIESLQSILKKEGIILKKIANPETNEIVGLRFEKDGFVFKGSQVHQTLSYNNLQKSINQNRKQNNNNEILSEALEIYEGRKLVGEPDDYLAELDIKEKEKYEISYELSKLLNYVPTLIALQNKLEQKGIKTEIIYKKPSNTAQGVVFKKTGSENQFKGSELSRKYSYSNILKKIEENQKAVNNNNSTLKVNENEEGTNQKQSSSTKKLKL